MAAPELCRSTFWVWKVLRDRHFDPQMCQPASSGLPALGDTSGRPRLSVVFTLIRRQEAAALQNPSATDVGFLCMRPHKPSRCDCYRSRAGTFRNCSNSTGAPLSTNMATRTPSDGSLTAPKSSLPLISASRLSTSNAICGTV